MKNIYTIVLLLAMVLGPVSVSAQTKRALVIGLGEYEDKEWSKINGDKDVPIVREYLKKAKYSQIVTLVNKEATKVGITSAFKTLAEDCKPNDVVYIHFSGHGQPMKDINNDEKDGLDECWVPYDAYLKPCAMDRGEKHLVDDEVNSLLNNIRDRIGDGGKMLVVIDACFSGTATRSPEETLRGVGEIFEAVKSYLEEPAEESVGPETENERWITLSACTSNQVNVEIKVPQIGKMGKLTYAIHCNLKNGNLGSNGEFFSKIRRFVKINTRGRMQKPEMTGETTKYNINDILR